VELENEILNILAGSSLPLDHHEINNILKERHTGESLYVTQEREIFKILLSLQRDRRVEQIGYSYKLK
jgi:hypothetical protein